MKKYYCLRLFLRALNLIPLIIATVMTIEMTTLPIIAPITYVYVIFLEFLNNSMNTKEEEANKIKNDYNNLQSASLNFI